MILYQGLVSVCSNAFKMDKELQAKIEEFKSCRVDKPQLEIIEHYKEGLRAVQDALDTVLERWKM